MNLKQWFDKWHLGKVQIKAPYVEAEFTFEQNDREAAWELYVELLTRIATQPLPDLDGDEKAALDSIYALFPITREILRRKGRDCVQFTKVAIVVLNQIVRPFTAKWHRLSLAGAFNDDARRRQFREELADLQLHLRNYTGMLADISGVEDLTGLASM